MSPKARADLEFEPVGAAPAKWAWAADAGAVIAVWGALIGIETALVGTVDRSLLAGSWEVVQARRLVAPIALAMLVPAAFLARLAGSAVVRASRDKWARRGVAVTAGLALGALAYGVSFGPHMQPPSVRIPFVALLAALGAAGGYVAPWALPRLSPRALAAAGAVVGVSAWWADVRVLPRLYPAFHLGLFVL